MSAPLNYEASAGPTNLQITLGLPTEVVQCLENARFLHLATCTSLQPHVSLMNYTYLPSTPYTPYPTIIMTTNPTSKKTENLISNPHVSILVHDWVSHRPPTTSNRRGSAASGSPPPEATRSSLASLLLGLNTSAISSISVTMNGTARLVERGTDEEKYLRESHLENNTFEGAEGPSWGPSERDEGVGDGGRGCFIEGEEVRVVVVRIVDGRVADWKGAVRDWVVAPERSEETGAGEINNGQSESLVNGVAASS